MPPSIASHQQDRHEEADSPLRDRLVSDVIEVMRLELENDSNSSEESRRKKLRTYDKHLHPGTWPNCPLMQSVMSEVSREVGNVKQYELTEEGTIVSGGASALDVPTRLRRENSTDALWARYHDLTKER